MSKQKTQTQIVSNAGMYYVCYRLSLLGWNVMPTSRNAKGIDIVAYTPEGNAFVGIQVKTLSSPANVPIGRTIEDQKRIWIIVVLSDPASNSANAKPTAFILTNEEINHLKDEYEKKGKKSLWIHKKKYFDKPGFKENWNRLKDQIYNK